MPIDRNHRLRLMFVALAAVVGGCSPAAGLAGSLSLGPSPTAVRPTPGPVEPGSTPSATPAPSVFTYSDCGTPVPAMSCVALTEPGEHIYAVGRSIATQGSRIVVVGRTVDGSRTAHPPTAAAWVSDDGKTWTQATADRGFEQESTLDDVVAFGTGFVAIGQNGSRPGVWVSADGRAWTLLTNPMEDDAWVRGITLFRGGLVAVGSVGGSTTYQQPAAWWSKDGLRWTRATVPPVDPNDSVNMTSVTAGPAGLVAVGSAFTVPKHGPMNTPAAWYSSDGQSWYRSAEPPVDQLPATFYNGVEMTSVAATVDRYVAIGGASDQPGAVAWLSTDGRDWSWISLDADTSASNLYGITTLGSAFVAVGGGIVGTNSWVHVCTSTDGSTWTWRPTNKSSHLDLLVSVAPYGRGIVAAGVRDQSAVVWISQ